MLWQPNNALHGRLGGQGGSRSTQRPTWQTCSRRASSSLSLSLAYLVGGRGGSRVLGEGRRAWWW